MKKISLLFVFFIFSFFLTNYVNANNSDIIKSLIGNYEGELIYPNGDKLPITTEVYLNDSGNLEGKYTFADFGGEEIKGNLYNFEIKSANKILIKWRDVYGRGWLEVNYSNDNFQGTWGVINNDVFEKAGDWNGRKIISTDSIESKLQKLKSFFEDELITQEEYDAKRKEILDEL
jgi:hypothetical protein